MTESKNYTVDIAMHSEEIKVYDLINICETRFRNGISANYLSQESTTMWMQPNHFYILYEFVWFLLCIIFLNRSDEMYRVIRVGAYAS